MQHSLPTQDLGANGQGMAEAVASCVHCGFCLAACPTYRLSGEEGHSPRGRILLMKEVLEGGLDAADARPYIDSCLGCLACEPACPSGVSYRHLLQPYRHRQVEAGREGRGLFQRLRKGLLLHTLPYPRRFRLALALARRLSWLSSLSPLRRLLPASLQPLVRLANSVQREGDQPPVPSLSPAQGRRRARVVVLPGCAQQVLAPQILRAAVRLLTHQGVECVVPSGDLCCGALAYHDGHWPLAKDLARRQWRSFPEDIDAVVSLAAGCGSAMQEYPVLLADEADRGVAERWAGAVCDVSELLHRLGLVTPLALPEPRRVVYQDACHLAQAQGVRRAPRQLLQQVEGLTLLEPAEADMCCGSAGTYNLEQPEMAHRLAVRKVDHLIATGAQMVASGNIGCIVQIRDELAQRGVDLPVLHTVEILAQGCP